MPTVLITFTRGGKVFRAGQPILEEWPEEDFRALHESSQVDASDILPPPEPEPSDGPEPLPGEED